MLLLRRPISSRHVIYTYTHTFIYIYTYTYTLRLPPTVRHGTQDLRHTTPTSSSFAYPHRVVRLSWGWGRVVQWPRGTYVVQVHLPRTDTDTCTSSHATPPPKKTRHVASTPRDTRVSHFVRRRQSGHAPSLAHVAPRPHAFT